MSDTSETRFVSLLTKVVERRVKSDKPPVGRDHLDRTRTTAETNAHRHLGLLPGTMCQ
jgi:hypothetical protein